MDLLEMRGIVKDFPGIRAVDRVDLSIAEGEIHALNNKIYGKGLISRYRLVDGRSPGKVVVGLLHGVTGYKGITVLPCRCFAVPAHLFYLCVDGLKAMLTPLFCCVCCGAASAFTFTLEGMVETAAVLP